jgi:O-antigen/teichoic acid export membrane protein
MQYDAGNQRGESRFVSNTVALVIQTVLATLLTLVQIKLLANYLTRDDFGLFASLRGLSLLLATLAANGLPQLLVRFIPVHESGNARRDAVRLGISCIAGSTLLLAAVIAIVHFLGSRAFAFVPAGTLSPEFFVWFYATTLGVTHKLILYGGLNGLRRLSTQVVIEMLSLVGILVWIAAERENLTILGLFRILGVVNLAAVAVGLPVFFRGLLRSTVGDERPGRAAEGAYLAYLWWAVGLSLVALAFSDVDRYLLAQVISLELLALFHIGSRVARLANRVLGVANLAFQPEVTRLDTEGRNERVLQSTMIFLKFNTTVAVLMAAAIIVFADEILVVIASGDYLSAAPLLMILAASLPLTTMTAPITSVMKAVDQVRDALICDLAWAGAYIVLMLVLAPMIGIVGVGLAQLAACLAQLLLALFLSRLPINGRRLVSFALRLGALSAVSFAPSALAGRTLGLPPAATVVFFMLGVFVFRWGLGRLGVYTAGEREALVALLEDRRLSSVGRIIGLGSSR